MGYHLINQPEPYSKLTPKERESAIVSLCGRIWARAMKEKILKEMNSSNEISPT